MEKGSVVNGKRSIKKSERNTPVKKSIRIRKEKIEKERRNEFGS